MMNPVVANKKNSIFSLGPKETASGKKGGPVSFIFCFAKKNHSVWLGARMVVGSGFLLRPEGFPETPKKESKYIKIIPKFSSFDRTTGYPPPGEGGSDLKKKPSGGVKISDFG